MDTQQGGGTVTRRRRLRGALALRIMLAACAAGLGIGVPRLDAQTTIARREKADNDNVSNQVLSRRVTVTLSHVPLQAAVDTIAELARVFVQYRGPMIRAYPKLVSVDVKNMPLGILLENVLDGTALRATSDGQGGLVILPIGDGVVSDSTPSVGTVAGRVVDSATGRGLGGATVKIAGTKLSVVTSDSGHFLLRNVPTGAQVLLTKLFGFRPDSREVSVDIGARLTVRVGMVSAPTVLSGVVTTATGMQRKIEVGNDITTINVDSVMRVAPISTVTDLLESRVPGLTVLHTSGTPGDPSRIRIRGASSITGNNDPIVIVDGVRVYASQSDTRNGNLAVALNRGGSTGSPVYAAPSPLDQIDPNSIQTIEVFKGPSASALYGSDAANGVIVITTKRGNAGPTHWDVSFGSGFEEQPGDWPVNYYRFGYGPRSQTGSPVCVWSDVWCTADSVVPFQALNDPRYTIFANHGATQNLSANVSGGVSTVQWALTGTTENHVGVLKLPAIEQQRYQELYGSAPPNWMKRPDNYKTAGGTAQLTVRPNVKTAVTMTSNLFRSAQQRSSLQGAVTQLQGEYINPLVLGTNPLVTDEMERATDEQLTATNALTMQWKPVAWLPLTAAAGLNTIQRNDEAYIPYGVNTLGVGVLAVEYDTNGYYSAGRGSSMDKTINVGTQVPLPHMTVSSGWNFHAGSTNDFTVSAVALEPGESAPSSFYPDSTTTTQSSASSSTYGWYLEPRLNLSSRFFASPGFRLDGGSASGANAGLTGLPKIDLSWVAIDENNPRGWLTLLRPRFAFGVAGTQPGPTEKLRLFNEGASNSIILLNGASVSAAFLSSLGNTQLRPETSRELEGGLDLSLGTDRVQLTATAYNKTKHDAIVTLPVASSVYGAMGAGTSIYYNIGTVRNTGGELNLTTNVIQSRPVSWNLGMNWSTNENVLVRLNPGALNLGDNPSLGLVTGYPLFSNWVKPIASYADVNGDGRIEDGEFRIGDSLVYVGSSEPKYQMNFTTDVSLLSGRVSVHATVSYQNGVTQNNLAALNSGAYAQLLNAPDVTLAEEAAVTAAQLILSNQHTLVGLYQTVNTLRFQSLSVNYAVPPSFSQRLAIPRLSVALQGSNLGLHSNYRGIDPNVNAFSTGNYTQDTGQLPQPRIWTLSFHVGN